MVSKTCLVNLNQYSCIPFSVFKLTFLLQGTTRNKAHYLKRKRIPHNVSSFHTYLTPALSHLVSLKCGQCSSIRGLPFYANTSLSDIPYRLPTCSTTVLSTASASLAQLYLLSITFQNNKLDKLLSHIHHDQAVKLFMSLFSSCKQCDHFCPQ